MKKLLSIILCAVIAATLFVGCSKNNSTPVKKSDFRVTAYVTCGDGLGENNFDPLHLQTVTDIIIFGNANFDENGKIILSDSFQSDLKYVKKYATNQNIYLNILGPGSQSASDDWNEQMHDLADRHSTAFESGILEDNILSVLSDNGLDGIVFDYEFPLRKKDWKVFDAFIISLRNKLGSNYKIGMSMVSWNLKQSKSAKEATDFFEVMSYDLWDKDGNHATFEIAQDDIKKFVKKGYDKATLDLGLPFYARPTTKDAYWYEYKSYYDKIDENGLYDDKETGLTFSFNTYDMIYDKTQWALSEGVGGVMIWNYDCDLPADNEKSLFNAIKNGIDSY